MGLRAYHISDQSDRAVRSVALVMQSPYLFLFINTKVPLHVLCPPVGLGSSH